MIDLKQMKQWRDGCGFQHRLLSDSSSAKKRTTPPKESSIEKIYQCIKSHNVITKKVIIKKTKMGELTVRKCLDVLVNRGEVTREKIGMSGPHQIHRYMVKE